ncbi:MAG: alpha-glucuronidase [Porphyromonadaceae bacterium]|nr:alpha-glucuronidase [Porphyromonadaceae bacterium]
MRVVLLFLFLTLFVPLYAEDGSRLWLSPAGEIALNASTLEIARSELAIIPLENSVIGTVGDERLYQYIPTNELQTLAEEEFLVRMVGTTLVVAGGSDRAVLYGVYRVVRDYAAGKMLGRYNLREKPSYALRLLNHWDNLDGSVERGYAGRSIWWEGDTLRTALYQAYARANASVGINGVVLNNVNASPQVLDSLHLDKVRRIADVLRPYGMRVYLSIHFSSPMILGGLSTADPLDSCVCRWWKEKVAEIYQLIPDFGGFLVKANSEGVPGPQDYGRTHADGANMLADALSPYGGVVMWRAFVYSPSEVDRAKQAYAEFVPLDGMFRRNVIVQVKNGPIDFQPREPFNPLFGAMRHTAVMPEFQITQEYLGFSNHLVFLAPLFEECLRSDTYVAGSGSTVARVTDGTLFGQDYTAIAGVANVGLDTNWCGHPFAQANWYAFGRLAWCDTLSSAQIADEWIRLTFSSDDRCVKPLSQLMMLSREAVVHYMMPMGLHHLFAFGHHYGPEPWGYIEGMRPDWMPVYYHRADSVGVGFDRTASGSNAVSQYAEPLRSLYSDINRCPITLLLWFHHVPWRYRLVTGRMLWEELCLFYQQGVDEVREMIELWQSVAPYIDSERFGQVEERLRIQLHDAVWWKDACLLYFQTFSQMPFPEGVEPSIYALEELKKIKLDMKQHN